MTPRRLAVCGVSVLALLVIAATFLVSGSAVQVTPPSPEAKVRGMCTALADALPDSVAGLERRDTEPSSPFTAAWGDSGIVLRCGVPRPAEMLDTKAAGGEIRGVRWLLENAQDGGHRCTTALRKAYVELTIPAKYGDVGALMDLAAAIKKTVPPLGDKASAF
ncbi:DUF3515 domain-containing protein [Streptomyces chattanoogensis]|uniref:DUF3515 domain-containing protein n=1 Tax=Streptomyces chattanoogensis TaxID=66876 RepID=UPI00367D86B8